MYIRNCTSSLIFFAYWDRRRLLAVDREDASIVGKGIPKHPNISLAPIIFLSLLSNGKLKNIDKSEKRFIQDSFFAISFLKNYLNSISVTKQISVRCNKPSRSS
jgi:hypothetical protein